MTVGHYSPSATGLPPGKLCTGHGSWCRTDMSCVGLVHPLAGTGAATTPTLLVSVGTNYAISGCLGDVVGILLVVLKA